MCLTICKNLTGRITGQRNSLNTILNGTDEKGDRKPRHVDVECPHSERYKFLRNEVEYRV